MTAGDRYRAMLRDEIAPALRARGFKGSGTAYVLPDDSHWLQIGFQASKWNSAEGVQFTVNVAVADKAAWEQLAAQRGYAGKPNPNVRYARDMPVRRLGSLAFGTDRWWEVPERTVTVAADVLEAIDRAALPWLRSKGTGP